MGRDKDKKLTPHERKRERERQQLLDRRRNSARYKAVARKLGYDLPFFDHLDNYIEEFQKLRTEIMRHIPEVHDIVETDEEFGFPKDWGVFGIPPDWKHLVFTYSSETPPEDGAVTQPYLLGVAQTFRDGEGRLRFVIFIRRTLKIQAPVEELKYVFKIGLLLHELGHVRDILERRNLNPDTGVGDMVASEVWATHPNIRILLEIDGAASLPVDATMENLDQYGPWVDLLELVRKARVVARQLRLKPDWSLNILDDYSAIQGIELMYGLLIDRKFEISPTDTLFDFPTSKAELKARPELKPGEFHKVTLADYGATFQFLGVPVQFENVAWHFPRLEMHTTREEIDQLVRGPEEEFLVRYRAVQGSRPVVRLLTNEEMRQLEVKAGQDPSATRNNDPSRFQQIRVSPIKPESQKADGPDDKDAPPQPAPG